MSKSVKAKSPINPTGRNPIKSASPYEITGVGEGSDIRSVAPKADPITDDDEGATED